MVRNVDLGRLGDFVEDFVCARAGGVDPEVLFDAYSKWVNQYIEYPEYVAEEFLEALGEEVEKKGIVGRWDVPSKKFHGIGLLSVEERLRTLEFAREYFSELKAGGSPKDYEESYEPWMIEDGGKLLKDHEAHRQGIVHSELKKAARKQGHPYGPKGGWLVPDKPRYRDLFEKVSSGGVKTMKLLYVAGAYDLWMSETRGGRPPGDTDSKVAVGLLEAAESLGYSFDIAGSEFVKEGSA